MKVKKTYYVLSLLVMISVVLASCAPQVAATTEAPAQTEAPAATEAPATEAPATQAPTEAPQTDRHGGWLDEIDVSVVAGHFCDLPTPGGRDRSVFLCAGVGYRIPRSRRRAWVIPNRTAAVTRSCSTRPSSPTRTF